MTDARVASRRHLGRGIVLALGACVLVTLFFAREALQARWYLHQLDRGSATPAQAMWLAERRVVEAVPGIIDAHFRAPFPTRARGRGDSRESNTRVASAAPPYEPAVLALAELAVPELCRRIDAVVSSVGAPPPTLERADDSCENAVRLLSRLKERARDAVPTLVRLCQARPTRLAILAIDPLMAIGPDASPALPALRVLQARVESQYRGLGDGVAAWSRVRDEFQEAIERIEADYD